MIENISLALYTDAGKNLYSEMQFVFGTPRTSSSSPFPFQIFCHFVDELELKNIITHDMMHGYLVTTRDMKFALIA